MRSSLILMFALCVSCDLFEPVVGSIGWQDVQGTTWQIVEEMNVFQSVLQEVTFTRDTIYLKKTYFDPRTMIIKYYMYMKGPVFNKRYVTDSDGDVDLFFTWSRKHFADPEFTTPVEGYSIVDDWFLYKIDEQDHLLMGLVNPPNVCYYWTFERKTE